MSDSNRSDSIIANSADYDAVVVGASLAGCATAIQLGRGGARLALVEKSPDPAAYKRMCSHFIQASAVPTLERLDLLDPILKAGGIRSRMRAWTPWGWIDPAPDRAGYAVNLRRERLDPLMRETAAATPGVELLLGHPAQRLVREEGAIRGVAVRDSAGKETKLRARLVVGADGRDSRIAELAEVPAKTLPHGRFAYGAYFEDATPPSTESAIWMMDPQWGAAFPTDSGLTFYAAMPTKDLLPEFKADPEAALVSFLAGLPEGPPIGSARRVSPVLGKIEMPNRVRGPVAPGLALVGDAALATDPLFGVGCGWALQSAEWLADSVAPALGGTEPLERGLKRYRRRHRRELRGHAALIHGYATGRPMDRGERMLFAAAARDEKVALAFDAFGTRRIKPSQMFATAIPRAMMVNARHSVRRRRDDAPAEEATLAA
jgi:2-polyprenyl-6-methoxyphenol hydroxylase-like FAD-dependent oxidoreductase